MTQFRLTRLLLSRIKLNSPRKKAKAALGFWAWCAAVSLTLAAAMTGSTFAWQVTNREVETTERGLSAEDALLTMEPCQVFLAGENGTVTQTSGLDSLTMNPYDFVFGDNDNTPVVVRVPVYGKTIREGQAITLTLSANGSVKDSDGKVNGILSNVVSIKGGLVPGLDGDETNAQTVYTTVKNAALGNAQSFATAQRSNGDTYTFTRSANTLTFSCSGYSGQTDGWLYYYFLIDYDWDLIDAYLHSHGTQRDVTAQPLAFTGDLQSLDLSFG